MKTRGAKNLTYTQRLQIETCLKLNLSKKKIAELLSINLSTVYKEIKRGLKEETIKYAHYSYYDKEYRYKKIIQYNADYAEANYKYKCTAKGAPLKIGKDYEFVRYIEKRINIDGLSPCAVLGEIKRKNITFATTISKPTLYRYISIGIFDNLKIQSKKKRYKAFKAKKPPRGTSIELRPKDIGLRNTFGHWEMDCVCGSTKNSLLVLSERLTRKELIFKIDSQQSKHVIHVLNILERRYGKNFRKIFKTITVDNGSEFSDFEGMEHSSYGRGRRTKIFYCHPYCSYERGTNERLNREIRRQIPKGSNLSLISDNEIRRVEKWINCYPREVLGFATSEELFNEQLQMIL